MNSVRFFIALLSCLVTTPVGVPSALAEGDIVAFASSGTTIEVLRGGETYLEFSIVGWGPGWQWLGFRAEAREENGTSHLSGSATVTASGAKLSYDVLVRAASPRRLELDIELVTDRDTPLTAIVLSVEIPEKSFPGGSVRLKGGSGFDRQVELPLGRRSLGEKVREIEILAAEGEKSVLSLSPPCDLTADGAARVLLAGRSLRAAAPSRARLAVTLPSKVLFHAGRDRIPDDADIDQWYPFQPSVDYEKPSELSLADWIEAPAGRHGRIQRRGDGLVYNGRPIKLWGLNVCYASCAPDRDLAERRAKFYARYGVNSVRLHKYADGPGWAGIQAKGSFVEFDAEALDRMDYFVAQLKRAGIYVLLSSTFGVKLGPDDRQRVAYIDEFGSGRNRVSTGHGSVFLSRELQDLQIEQIVKLLEHRNPYTKMTYGADPAVAVVELFNEDSALFYGTLTRLQKVPTLRRRAAKRFCAWLEKRYGSEEALQEAWGEGALNSFGNEGLVGESWKEKTIVPAGNPWFYDPDQLEGSQRVKRRRLLDTMRFLYELQNEFYARYVEAIRKTGYGGEILASNWQAGRAFSHYFNLHSDYLVGTIDRHNYFGGGSGPKIQNASMLRTPGSGMLSAGMQQVGDRPFMLSEWIHVFPNEWGVEGPAIIGAYGMGLQGWDVSYMFQNRDGAGFLERLGRDRWEVTAPQVLGVFPAVARQVLRGDVRESEVVASRYVHLDSLAKGRIGFEERVTQAHDVKTFDGDKVPARTLAVARSVVEFVEEPRETPAFDLSRYHRDGLYRASTGELEWKEGASRHDGYFTMDTPSTQAVVGFARGRVCELSQVTITSHSRFGAVYVTAKEKDRTIATSKRLLVVALARARNTGMKIWRDSRLLERGGPPVRLEPVRATIELRRKGRPTVILLDHDGALTEKTLPVKSSRIEIDSGRDRTPYYLIQYE